MLLQNEGSPRGNGSSPRDKPTPPAGFVPTELRPSLARSLFCFHPDEGVSPTILTVPCRATLRPRH